MPPDAPATEQSAAPSGTDFGLDADEQAVFDAMKSEPSPTGDPGHIDPEAPAEPVAATPEPAPAGTPGSEPPVAGAAPVAEPADDIDDDDAASAADGSIKPTKRVGWTKFKKVQDEAAATAAELRTEREKNAKAAETQARLDERLRLINEALTTQPVAAAQDDDPEPDPEADIFGHNAWLKRQLVKTRETFDERINQIESGRNAEAGERQLETAYRSDAERFAATEPNFWEGYAHLRQVRFLQLAYDNGKDLTDPKTPPLTPEEFTKISRAFFNEEKGLVAKALKENKSPAQVAYGWARMTGFRPRTAEEISAARVAAAAPVAANGATLASAAITAPAAPPTHTNGVTKPSVKAVIDGIKNGQAAALSLSDGGGAPAPVLNMEKLASMPEDEFGAMLDSMTPQGLRRIMGGA